MYIKTSIVYYELIRKYENKDQDIDWEIQNIKIS